jgi:transcriptional regulator with XRE-family HTH domain
VSPTPGAAARERHWTCADRLRQRRRQLGLTQLDVVALLRGRDACLTNRALSAMENGRGVDLGILPDLAAVLDCSITYLLGLTADPSAWQPDRPLDDSSDPESSDPLRPAPSTADADPVSSPCSWILGPDVPAVAPRSGALRARGPD